MRNMWKNTDINVIIPHNMWKSRKIENFLLRLRLRLESTENQWVDKDYFILYVFSIS